MTQPSKLPHTYRFVNFETAGVFQRTVITLGTVCSIDLPSKAADGTQDVTVVFIIGMSTMDQFLREVKIVTDLATNANAITVSLIN